MKKLLTALLMLFFAAAINMSCTKTNLKNPSSSQNLNSDDKANPNVIDCGIGYHWDFYLKKCVQTCSTGYHNDSITGACVVDGGGGGSQNYLIVVANPNNPEEVIGQKHNAGMAAIMPYYSDGTLEPTEQNVFSYTKSYLVTKNYDTVFQNNVHNYVLQKLGDVYQQTDLTPLTNEIYSEGYISTSAKNYLIQLANSISSFTSDSISIPTQTAYNSFANSLIAYENQMLSDLSLSTTDKYILFSAYSVARYSAVFDINYAIQESSSQMQIANSIKGSQVNPAKASGGWFSWKTVVGGDVVGGAVGALGGAAVGVMAGGIGAGPGAASGAVGGAIMGSGYEAGMQVWHHFFGN